MDNTIIDFEEQQKLIGKMTNWQRTKWQRSGGQTFLEALTKYANLPHYKSAK